MSNVIIEENHHHHAHYHQSQQQPQSQQQQQQQTQQIQQQQQQNQSQQQQQSQQQSHLPSSNDISGEPPHPAGEAIEQHCRLVEEELQNVRESESRCKQQLAEAQRREKMLVRRLAVKEQELQDYASQNAELKASHAPTMASLRSALLDPAVNILFQKLKAELQTTKARLEDTQNELSAWKFTPDSNTGKRLMAKCRLLYQENEELGKMTSNGRLAKLEGDLALQKSFSEEVKKSQSELDDFLQELDEDVEGMQSTILFLQQELKLAKETIVTLERENFMLKNGNHNPQQRSYKDTELTENNDNCIINGARTTITPTTITLVETSISSPDRGCPAETEVTGNLVNNSNTNSNKSNISDRVLKVNSSAKSTVSSVETRTLRSSGRNITAVVDELRTSKLNLNKPQFISNSNGDSGVDGSCGISGSDLTNYNEQRHQNGGNYDVNATNSYSVNMMRKSYKRSYKEVCDQDRRKENGPNTRKKYSAGENDEDDDEGDDLKGTSYSDENDAYKTINNNLKHSNNSESRDTSVTGGNGTNSTIVSSKRTRRSSVLSLDLSNENNHMDLKSDDCPLNLVTPGSSSASSSDILSSSTNGII